MSLIFFCNNRIIQPNLYMSKEYPHLDLELITQHLKLINGIEESQIQQILEKPAQFLKQIRDNEISVNRLLHIVKKEPKIKDLTYQGLSFFHYLALSNNYDLVFNIFPVVLSQGVSSIPLTENFVSISSYKTNQSFFDFIFDQDCLESYKAFYPNLKKDQNHLLTNIINASTHNKKNWIKFYDSIYGSDNIEKIMTTYFNEPENKFYFIYFLNKIKFSFSSLNKVGINLFRDDGDGSLLANYFTDKDFLEKLYYQSTYLEKETLSKFGKHIKNSTLFLEKIITDPKYNPLEKSMINNETLGSFLTQFIENRFPEMNLLNDYNQKLILEKSIKESSHKNRKLKF